MRFILIFWMLLVGTASAQTYPDYSSTTVNDFADLITPSDESALVDQLTRLKGDTGIEMTVVTLVSQADWAADRSLESFATGLFNHWGIGNAQRNDGVLVLVLRDDRTMRVELGAAYARTWDSAAEWVVDSVFLPAFRAGEFSAGIRSGSDALIKDIVKPFLAGATPSGSSSDWREISVFALMAAVFGAFSLRRLIGDAMVRLRTCPSCGRRGLRQTRRTVISATKAMTGQGKRHIRCTHCDYEEESHYIIPVRSSRSSGGFGGGRSGGGGASGRW